MKMKKIKGRITCLKKSGCLKVTFVFELDCNRKYSGCFKNEYNNIIKVREMYVETILSSLCFLESLEKGALYFQGAAKVVNIMTQTSFLKL